MITPTLQFKNTNGVRVSVQLRTLSWRERDAQAEAIVTDPKRRLKWDKGKRSGVKTL